MPRSGLARGDVPHLGSISSNWDVQKDSEFRGLGVEGLMGSGFRV